MNAIQIFGENRVVLSTLSAYSGAASLPYVKDQKPATLWQSVGSDDAVNEFITSYFLNKSGSNAAYAFDRVVLLNTNVKSMKLYYYTSVGGTPVEISEGDISDNTQANRIIEMAALPSVPYGLSLSMYTTQTADEQKYLGELKACKHIMTLNALTEMERGGEARCGDYRVINGDLVKWRDWEKFGARLTMRNVSQAQRTALRQALADYDFLTFVFNDDADDMEVYEVSVAQPISERFNRKTGLYELDLEMKER